MVKMARIVMEEEECHENEVSIYESNGYTKLEELNPIWEKVKKLIKECKEKSEKLIKSMIDYEDECPSD